MKVTIKDNKKQTKSEPEMSLYLQEYGDGVALKATDANGKDWFILVINKNGRIERSGYITFDSGWPLDDGQLRQLQLEPEYNQSI
jgi:hypothetical protein